jgi:peptidoglycan/LPS O-acetylase OafA/YrhL
MDGLRCLAITSVVLFHAGLPPFPGGFAGVDIFFVISGYLISSIIMESMSQRSFSALAFYERRARRLLPALFFAIALTMLGGLFTLTPEDYSEMLRSAAATSFFASNVFFFMRIDYFAQAAEYMPLLHTWSLAVEEQFYLFWPYLLLGYTPTGPKKRLVWALVGAVFVCSFGASLVAIERASEGAFYLIFFRLWELGAGGITAILCRERPGVRNFAPNATFALGASCVFASLVLLDSESPPLGLDLLPLVVGTCLMIVSGDSPRNILARPLRAAPAVFVGKISYSLYLLHWPVLALYRNYQSDTELTTLHGVLLLALAFLLAVFSYFFIENPVRLHASKKFVTVFGSTGVLVLSSACFAGIVLDGFPQRISEGFPEYARSQLAMSTWDCERSPIEGLKGEHCVFGADWEQAERRIFLWGDSHAGHFAPLIDYTIDPETTSVLRFGACPPFLDDINVHRWYWLTGGGWSRACGIEHATAMAWLLDDSGVDAILMAAAWSGYPKSLYMGDHRRRSARRGTRLLAIGLDATLARLPPDVPVHILTDVPRPRRKLIHCVRGQGGMVFRKPPEDCDALDRADVDAWHQPTTSALERVASSYDHVSAHDSVDSFCSETSCDIFVEGRLLYLDKNHIRFNLTDREISVLVDRLGVRAIVEEIETRN